MSLTVRDLRLKHVESTIITASYKTPLDVDTNVAMTYQVAPDRPVYVFFTHYAVLATYTQYDYSAAEKPPFPTVTHDVWRCEITFAATVDATEPVDDARLKIWADTTLLRWQHDSLREHLHWLSGAAGLTPLLIEPPAELIRRETAVASVLAGLHPGVRPTSRRTPAT